MLSLFGAILVQLASSHCSDKMAVQRRFVIEELNKKRIYSSSVKYSDEFRDFLGAHFDRHDNESLEHFKAEGKEVGSKLRGWLGLTPKARSAGKSRAKLKDILSSSSHKVFLLFLFEALILSHFNLTL